MPSHSDSGAMERRVVGTVPPTSGGYYTIGQGQSAEPERLRPMFGITAPLAHPRGDRYYHPALPFQGYANYYQPFSSGVGGASPDPPFATPPITPNASGSSAETEVDSPYDLRVNKSPIFSGDLDISNDGNVGEDADENEEVDVTTNSASEYPQVTLKQGALWAEFHRLGNEMTVNRAGRHPFPRMEFNVSGLNPQENYYMLLDIVQADKFRYKFFTKPKGWVQHGVGLASNSTNRIVHPRSPNTGAFWMTMGVNFVVKLKNLGTAVAENNEVLVNLCHMYQPRLHIGRAHPLLPFDQSPFRTFVFKEMEFIAVFSFRSSEVRALKRSTNIFARFAPRISIRTRRDVIGGQRNPLELSANSGGDDGVERESQNGIGRFDNRLEDSVDDDADTDFPPEAVVSVNAGPPLPIVEPLVAEQPAVSSLDQNSVFSILSPSALTLAVPGTYPNCNAYGWWWLMQLEQQHYLNRIALMSPFLFPSFVAPGIGQGSGGMAVTPMIFPNLPSGFQGGGFTSAFDPVLPNNSGPNSSQPNQKGHVTDVED